MKKIFLIPIIFIMAILSTSIIWGVTPQGPSAEIDQYLVDNNNVTVRNERWLTFFPEESSYQTGLIIYPGGHVDYRSYAQIAFSLAKKGIPTVIVPMPLSLAVLNSDAASEVITAYPEINQWVIGGHSLGGTMAANFAYKHPDAISGLVMWGAYPADSNDLSNSNIPVISIYASEDGLSSVEDITSRRHLLPSDTQYILIDGGNHSQMGWYGDQRGDNPAFISRADQQLELINATWGFLKGLDE